jgi:hypothetical protein
MLRDAIQSARNRYARFLDRAHFDPAAPSNGLRQIISGKNFSS